MTTLITKWPQSDDHTNLMAAIELVDVARTIALLLASKCRHVPDDSRREMAEYICDAIDNALQDVGGRLDGAVFLALCEMHKAPA